MGVNVGESFGDARHPYSVDIGSGYNGSLDFRSDGFLGGVQAGYNWQSGPMIFGIEVDFQGANIDGHNDIGIGSDGNVGGFGPDLGTGIEWFGTVRGRIGAAATDRMMVYGTGGFAYGHYKSAASYSYDFGGPFSGSGSVSKSGTSTGWAIGAGTEYAVTDHVTFKGEYLYTDLGKDTLYSDDLGGIADATVRNDVAFHTFRIGLNYKF